MNMANLLHTDTAEQKVTNKSVLALYDLGVIIKLWGSAKDVFFTRAHVEKRHIETKKRKGKNQVYFLALNWLKLFL